MTRVEDKIRLASIEQGFSDNVNNHHRRREGDPFAIYDELDSPIRSPEILPHREDHQPSRSSQEDNRQYINTHTNQIT